MMTKKKKYELECIDNSGTDCPMRLTNLIENKSKIYLVEGLGWKLLNYFPTHILSKEKIDNMIIHDVDVLDHIWNNVDDDEDIPFYEKDDI